jgi:hypothetical protein
VLSRKKPWRSPTTRCDCSTFFWWHSIATEILFPRLFFPPRMIAVNGHLWP